LARELIKHLSEERFHSYLVACGHDPDRALRLYEWNMRIAASFYPLLSSVEICLRNQIEPRIRQVFEPVWWEDVRFHELLGNRGKGIVLRARGKICERQQEVTAGRMTAELSFGFWVNMLLEKYDSVLWENIHESFGDLPDGKAREDLRMLSAAALDLRNRISHHEPIFKRDLSKDYAQAMELMRWLGPAKAEWIRPQLDTMRILRERP
jgi:hypothetical protein